MTDDEVNAIYDILVTYGGAPEHMRMSFFYEYTRTDKRPINEWRFQGHFGFGGKLWVYDDRIYVNYYPEHRTPELDALQEDINSRLKEILHEQTA